MATRPVRIRGGDKAVLERLRREVLDATGEKPTQQEALGAALPFALRHRGDLVAEATWQPLAAKQSRAWVAEVEADEGFEAVPPDRIDDVVYGEG